jgi:ABC-2 type transport system permease protein
MKKYLRIFRYAARDQLMYLPTFLIRNLFFVVIVFTFWSLWKVIFAGRGALAGLTITQTLWYLTFTETIELSKSRVLFQVQEEVKDGTLTVTLSRPYSYPLFHLSRAMGESVVRIVPILLEGTILCTLMVGPLASLLPTLPQGLLLIVMGVAVTNLWMLLIGLLAFWLEEVTPFYWIVQKLIFILGGLFLPIDLFPGWLAGIARVLPFAFSAYWPAYTIVSGSGAAFITGFVGASLYIIVLVGAVLFLFSLGRKRVHAPGG